MPEPGHIMRPAAPRLFDSASVIGSDADPGAVVEGSGYIGRIFYLRRPDWHLTRFPDVISRREAASYKAHGLAIVLNFEDAAADWCLAGYDVGRARGDACAAQLDDIDCASAAVYMSVDFRPAGPGEMDAVMQCLAGFQASALGVRGRAVYGFAPTIREAAHRDLADYFWLCGDGRELLLGGRDADLHGRVNIWQQNNEAGWLDGSIVDDNYVFTRDEFGQWRPGIYQRPAIPDQECDNMSDAAHDVQEQLRGPDLAGWPTRRYHLSPEAQPRFTAVDLGREIDAKLNSRLPVHGDPGAARPVAPDTADDLWGHVLSARAETLQNQAILVRLAEAAKVDISDILAGPA